MLSDEVWAGRSPDAGVAPASLIRRTLLVGCALAMAATVAGGLWLSGLVVPLLEQHRADGDGGGTVWTEDELGRRTRLAFEERLRFVNAGGLPVTVTGVGLRADGLKLLSVRADDGRLFPRTVPAGGSVTLTLDMEITDCGPAATVPARVELRIERWWGTVSGTAVPRSLLPDEPWQDFRVGSACG